MTANRDENPARSTSGLSAYTASSGGKFHMAKEPIFGGTNLAVGEGGKAVVLLNGAFAPHEFGKTYRRSRGLMVLDFLEFSGFDSFLNRYDFSGIEPFTLVYFDGAISELRWDGTAVHRDKLAPDLPHIWASAQLYSAEVIEKRKRWFARVLSELSGELDSEQLFDFHENGGDGDGQNDMVMNRFDLVKTVSISQITRNEERVILRHLNMLTRAEEIIEV